MSDNVTFQTSVTATPPNATTVATDNISGVHYQQVKMVFGNDGTAFVVSSGTPLPVAGTVQPLAGSVHLASGLPGTVQALGTVQPLAGSVHVANTIPGTVQALGTVQTHGTGQMLGTVQPLAGSVHLASGLPGTVQALGTIQPLAGSVHVANTIPGTVQVLGSVQTVGTSQVLGTVQTVGTRQVLGTIQPLAGSVHVANTIPGTVQVLGSVQPVGTSQVLGTVATRTVAPILERAFGTVFTAAVTNGTLVPAAGQGTYVRVWDVMVSGSAAGSAFLELGDGTPFGHVFNAASGGFALNSARGIRTPGTNTDVLFNCAAGSWGVSINYTLET